MSNPNDIAASLTDIAIGAAVQNARNAGLRRPTELECADATLCGVRALLRELGMVAPDAVEVDGVSVTGRAIDGMPGVARGRSPIEVEILAVAEAMEQARDDPSAVYDWAWGRLREIAGVKP